VKDPPTLIEFSGSPSINGIQNMIHGMSNESYLPVAKCINASEHGASYSGIAYRY